MSSRKSGNAALNVNVAKWPHKSIILKEKLDVIGRMAGGQSRPVDPAGSQPWQSSRQ
jgi:hypothetical protein